MGEMRVASDVAADDRPGVGVCAKASRPSSVSGYTCSCSVAESRQVVLILYYIVYRTPWPRCPLWLSALFTQHVACADRLRQFIRYYVIGVAINAFWIESSVRKPGYVTVISEYVISSW